MKKIKQKNSLTPGVFFSWDDVSIEQPETGGTWKDELVLSVVNGTIPHPEHATPALDAETQWLLDDALRTIPPFTTLPVQHNFIQQLLRLYTGYLNDRQNRRGRDFMESRDAFQFFYARYLLNQPQDLAKTLFLGLLGLTLPQPPARNTEDLAEFLYDVIKEFIRAVNGEYSVENFWALWECLRDWMLEKMNATLMPLFLMDLDWSADSENWHVLEGKALFYKEFVEKWGFNRINESLKFIAGVAFKQFMPGSVSWVARMLDSQEANKLDIKSVVKFVEKAFYRYGNKIKEIKPLLIDFITILDFLVDKGSSSAYMLRDELIQYK